MKGSRIEAVTAAAEKAIEEITTMVGEMCLDRMDVDNLCGISRMLDGVVLSGNKQDVFNEMVASLKSIEDSFYGLRISGMVLSLKANPEMPIVELRQLNERLAHFDTRHDIDFIWGASFDKSVSRNEIYLAILVGLDVDSRALSA